MEAGVSLCISRPIMKPSDWSYLFDKQALLLAIPGIIAGILLTGVARKCQDEAMLPISMVVIPVVFYIVLFACGWSIEDAREGGWVGETSPPVPVQDLFHLIDFGKVRWDLCKEIIPTWLGRLITLFFNTVHLFHQNQLIPSRFHPNRYGIRGFILFLLGCCCY